MFIQLPQSAVHKGPTIINNSSVQRFKKLSAELKPIETIAASMETAPQSKAKTNVANTPTPVSAGSCEQAIAAVWPIGLQDGARLVSTKESSMIKDQIGPIRPDGTVGYNYDGSRDYGCFQINNKAHADFFANGDWRDPIYNAQYALKIYNERGNWTAWYAVRGILW